MAGLWPEPRIAAEGKRESPAGQGAMKGQQTRVTTPLVSWSKQGSVAPQLPTGEGQKPWLKDSDGCPALILEGMGQATAAGRLVWVHWIPRLPLGGRVDLSLGPGVGNWLQGLEGWAGIYWRTETRAVGLLPHHKLKTHVGHEPWSG